eukprot:PhF_6_TR18536/c0_g1_i1/m.27070
MKGTAGKTYLFRDRFNGLDMFSVAQPYRVWEENEAIFVVKSQNVVKKSSGDVDIGASNFFKTEGGDEAVPLEDGDSVVNNIVDTYGFQEMTMTKKSLMEWAKPYLGRVKAELSVQNPDRVDPFMKGAQAFMKKIGETFEDWCFYINSAMDFEAGLIFAKYEDGATVPEFFFFRDGLVLCFPGTGTSLSVEARVSPAVAAREGYLI